MAAPSNPGWPFGYVPTADEWADAFGGKVDYPAPLDQGGTGSTTSSGANYAFQQRRLISATLTSLTPLSFNGIRTAIEPVTLTLPLISGLQPADWIDVADVDYNANNNNITINAAGPDFIYAYGAAAPVQVLNIAGVRVRLVANVNSWCMLV